MSIISRSSRPTRKKEQRTEPDQAGGPRDPVRKEQGLRASPQPESQIHGMAHAIVHAAGHETVLIAHFQCGGPIASEIPVRAIKQPEGGAEQRGAEPALPRSKRVVRELRCAREQRKSRE